MGVQAGWAFGASHPLASLDLSTALGGTHGRAFVDKNGKFKPPPLNRNEFGMVLGGPIVRGKTFFFGDYQGRRQVRGSVAYAIAKSLAAQGVATPQPGAAHPAG